MTKYETTTEETEILVLEARIDELKHIDDPVNVNCYYEGLSPVLDRIAELTTQLQAFKQKARVS